MRFAVPAECALPLPFRLLGFEGLAASAAEGHGPGQYFPTERTSVVVRWFGGSRFVRHAFDHAYLACPLPAELTGPFFECTTRIEKRTGITMDCMKGEEFMPNITRE